MATFFSLPIELRNIIYSIILISSHNIKICSLPGKYLRDREGHKRPRYRKRFGQLLLVNKQVYTEASFIFYSENTFAIGIRSGPPSGYAPDRVVSLSYPIISLGGRLMIPYFFLDLRAPPAGHTPLLTRKTLQRGPQSHIPFGGSITLYYVNRSILNCSKLRFVACPSRRTANSTSCSLG